MQGGLISGVLIGRSSQEALRSNCDSVYGLSLPLFERVHEHTTSEANLI